MTEQFFTFLSDYFEDLYKKLIPLAVKDTRHLGSFCGVFASKTLLMQVQDINAADSTTLFYFKFRLGHLRDARKIKDNAIIYDQINSYMHADSNEWQDGYKKTLESIDRFINSYLFTAGATNQKPDDIIEINTELAKFGNFKI